MNGTAQDQSLRNHLTRLLDWHDAHADFDRVVANLPAHVQGVRPDGLPYSLWQLLDLRGFFEVSLWGG